jgi:hypothetical protein
LPAARAAAQSPSRKEGRKGNLAPEAVVNGVSYRINVNLEIAPVPPAFQARLKKPDDTGKDATIEPDLRLSIERTRSYLADRVKEKCITIINHGGDDTPLEVSCRLKDFGVLEPKALELLRAHWESSLPAERWAGLDGL